MMVIKKKRDLLPSSKAVSLVASCLFLLIVVVARPSCASRFAVLDNVPASTRNSKKSFLAKSNRPSWTSVPRGGALSLAAARAGNATSTTAVASATATATASATAAATISNNNKNSKNNNFIIGDVAAKFLLSLLPRSVANNNVRTLHAILVAMNLFWYQAIRQTVAVMSVFMCTEFSGMDTTQQAQLIAAPSVGNILTQAIGGFVIHLLPGGTKTAITIALMGLATGCTFLPSAINSNSKFPLKKAFILLTIQGVLFGPMFPSHSVLLSKWLPPNERGSAMAYGEIAMSIASMGVPLVVTSIAEYTATATGTGTSATSIAGWRNGFYVTGMACFGYLVVWMILGRNEPESCSYISNKELQLIQSIQKKSTKSSSTSINKNKNNNNNKKKNATTVSVATAQDATSTRARTSPSSSQSTSSSSSSSWRTILFHPSILSLFFVHMVYNFVTLSVNSWMPTYYNDVLQLKPNDAKLHIVLPQVTALLIKLFVSKFAGVVQQVRRSKRQRQDQQNDNNNNNNVVKNSPSSSSNRTRNKNINNNAAAADDEDDERSLILFSRRFMGYLGFAVTAVPLWFLPMVASSPESSSVSMPVYSPWWSTALFSVALAGTGFHAESFRANYLDVTQKHVGLVSGVGNCLSSVSAMVAPFVVGKIIKITHGDWSPVWRFSSISCVIAALVFGTFSTTIPVEEHNQ